MILLLVEGLVVPFVVVVLVVLLVVLVVEVRVVVVAFVVVVVVRFTPDRVHTTYARRPSSGTSSHSPV